jgi:hypothetical protein
MSISTFDSTKEALSGLLNDAACGKLQLPDFQRGWVWDDYGIRSLLASVSQSFPIGAVMMLQTGGDVRFRPRPIEGADSSRISGDPERLILDGQQRLTSMYQACFLDQPVETQNEQRRRIRRWYYLDIARALDPTADREEAILGVPEDRRITRDFGREVVLDVTTREREYENSLFPVNRLFSPDDWADGYQEFWDYQRDRIKFFRDFKNEVIAAFQHYHVPVIALKKETTKEAVCLVFEKVNTGGKKLDSFELLTAIYAADDFNLRDDWLGEPRDGEEGRLARLSRYNVLKNIASTDFLQAIALLHTSDVRAQAIAQGITNPKELPPVSCQRKAILNLPLAAYRRYADHVEEGFSRAARFLTLLKVFSATDVPYRTQIVPLAAILVRLSERWEQQHVRKHLARWFWCGVFGELYGSATETRFAKDFVEVPSWVDGGAVPTTIIDASFSPDRLRTLRSRLSAAYKGLNALLKVVGACDLRSGQPIEYSLFWEESVDIHHIFPKAWCEKHGIERGDYDGIVNKTLSQRAPTASSPHAPLRRTSRRWKQRCRFPPVRWTNCSAPMRSTATGSVRMISRVFVRTRAERLLALIENAMGKPIPRDQPSIEGEDAGESIDELLESIENEAPLLPQES